MITAADLFGLDAFFQLSSGVFIYGNQLGYALA
jgi:hypothetical protein